MNVERLLTLKDLAAKTGQSVEFFRGIVERREIAVVRRTPRGRIHITEAAWQAWQAAHTSTGAERVEVGVQLDPPKKAPARATDRVNVDHLISKGFQSPIARSY